MIPVIDPEEDYLTIAAAEEQMSITEEERRKELEEAHGKMRCKIFFLICFPMARLMFPFYQHLLVFSSQRGSHPHDHLLFLLRKRTQRP